MPFCSFADECFRDMTNVLTDRHGLTQHTSTVLFPEAKDSQVLHLDVR